MKHPSDSKVSAGTIIYHFWCIKKRVINIDQNAKLTAETGD